MTLSTGGGFGPIPMRRIHDLCMLSQAIHGSRALSIMIAACCPAHVLSRFQVPKPYSKMPRSHARLPRYSAVH